MKKSSKLNVEYVTVTFAADLKTRQAVLELWRRYQAVQDPVERAARLEQILVVAKLASDRTVGVLTAHKVRYRDQVSRTDCEHFFFRMFSDPKFRVPMFASEIIRHGLTALRALPTAQRPSHVCWIAENIKSASQRYVRRLERSNNIRIEQIGIYNGTPVFRATL